MAAFRQLLLAAAPALAAGSASCPGSPMPSLLHASCEVEVKASAPCAAVMAEMEARVAGIRTGTWHDPHNNGNYSVEDKSENVLVLKRVTGNKLFTDKLMFTLEDGTEGSTCIIQGCSESQVPSFADFSTNYCNLRMLYCGEAEGCTPVLKDFAIAEAAVHPSLGASAKPEQCFNLAPTPPPFPDHACPGISWPMHAHCQVELTALANCDEVMGEMQARVVGISDGSWHDPHNNGTYSLLDQSSESLEFQRVTGNKMFTDKLKFTFEDFDGGRVCRIRGCSQSQIPSVADFSTNYCNLRMLYCGSDDGCKPVLKDVAIAETSVSPSLGASKNPEDCLKMAEGQSGKLRNVFV
mmetsp:Transcript_30358/g.56922  ORF Transcript_30358/g.56922 Transcript_30358/m.56922 type:complete len:352 (+) Transcript_30358:61-1116(+)